MSMFNVEKSIDWTLIHFYSTKLISVSFSTCVFHFSSVSCCLLALITGADVPDSLWQFSTCSKSADADENELLWWVMLHWAFRVPNLLHVSLHQTVITDAAACGSSAALHRLCFRRQDKKSMWTANVMHVGDSFSTQVPSSYHFHAFPFQIFTV